MFCQDSSKSIMLLQPKHPNHPSSSCSLYQGPAIQGKQGMIITARPSTHRSPILNHTTSTISSSVKISLLNLFWSQDGAAQIPPPWLRGWPALLSGNVRGVGWCLFIFFYLLTICHLEYILSPLCFETSLSPGNPWRPWFQPRREGRRGKIWNHNRLKAWKCSMGTLSNCDFTQWVQNSKWFKLQIFWWTVSLFSKVGGAIQWSFVVKLRNLKEPSDWTHICQIMLL